jgi:pimeloyl-ACP methyl ester carboxylesterase
MRHPRSAVTPRWALSCCVAAAVAAISAGSAVASEPYAVTPISGTYLGNFSGQELTCTYRRTWFGYRPTTPGTYPLYVHLPPMFSTPNAPDNLKAGEEFAKRGFIAVSIEYPNWDYSIDTMISKALCPFSNQPSSVTSLLCAYNNGGVSADCDTKGIVTGGFSLGGTVAQLANDFDPRVKATVSIGAGGSGESSTPTMDVPWQPAKGRQLPPSRLRVQIGLLDGFLGLGSPSPFLGENEATGVNCAYPTSADAPTTSCLGPLGNGWVAVATRDLTPPSKATHCYISTTDCFPFNPDPFVWGSDPSPQTHPFTLDAAADWAQSIVTQGFNQRTPRTIDDTNSGTRLYQANYALFQWAWAACSTCYGGGNMFSGVTNATVTLPFYGVRIDVYARKSFASGVAAFSVDGGPETNVDLYAPHDVDGVVAYSKSVPLGLHTLKVRVTGTKNASAWGSFVGVDEFVVQ